MDQDQRIKWTRSFKKLVTKALIDTNGVRAVFKNPVMTGRVPVLLEAFPDARFIYMYRNPIEVFLSSKRFFTKVVETLWFHEVDNEFIGEMILEIYVRILEDFEKQKSMIPKQNYYEIRFEEFQENPFEHLKKIYRFFGYDNFEDAAPYFKAYLGEQKAHKTTQHVIQSAQLDRVLDRWGFAMKAGKYDIPENLKIIS
jgi:hypothetical protein